MTLEVQQFDGSNFELQNIIFYIMVLFSAWAVTLSFGLGEGNITAGGNVNI